MKKNNLRPAKWILGILIVLMALVYCTHEVSKNIAMSAGTNISSENIFFQFLANIFGIRIPGSSSEGSLSQENDASNLNNPNSRSTGGINAGNKQNLNSILTGNGSASGIGPQGSGSPGNSLGMNAGNNAGSNAENNMENNSGSISETNAGQVSGNIAESNTDQGTGNTMENSTDNSSGTNAEQGAGNISGTNTDQGTTSTSGTSTDNTSGDNSGTGTNQGSGNDSGSSYQSNLPTINPIPSDDQVAQNIAKQNQQNDSLASLLAAHQALVVPVQQQSQASKYQTVNSQNIPAPSTNQVPDEVVQKVKSNQAVISH